MRIVKWTRELARPPVLHLSRFRLSCLRLLSFPGACHIIPRHDVIHGQLLSTQFQPLVVESFESGPEIYLAVLRKTPHRASEIVRYLRGTVSHLTLSLVSKYE